MTPAELLMAVASCDDCTEAAPSLCDAHEQIAQQLEARAEAATRRRHQPPTVTYVGNFNDLLRKVD